jgi:hypothetical protein
MEIEETAIAITEDKIHELAELTPVKKIETSLVGFLENVFLMVQEEDAYQKAIKSEIISRLPDMKPSELIALATSAMTNKNDLVSKTMAPIAQLLTAAQQNELAARQNKDSTVYQQTNIREVNNMAPSEVLTGLQALFNLANASRAKDEIVQSDN